MNIHETCKQLNELLKIVDLTEVSKVRAKTTNLPEADNSQFMFGNAGDHYTIGLIGVINGLIDGGVICGVYDDGRLVEFRVYSEH